MRPFVIPPLIIKFPGSPSSRLLLLDRTPYRGKGKKLEKEEGEKAELRTKAARTINGVMVHLKEYILSVNKSLEFGTKYLDTALICIENAIEFWEYAQQYETLKMQITKAELQEIGDDIRVTFKVGAGAYYAQVKKRLERILEIETGEEKWELKELDYSKRIGTYLHYILAGTKYALRKEVATQKVLSKKFIHYAEDAIKLLQPLLGALEKEAELEGRFERGF